MLWFYSWGPVNSTSPSRLGTRSGSRSEPLVWNVQLRDSWTYAKPLKTYNIGVNCHFTSSLASREAAMCIFFIWLFIYNDTFTTSCFYIKICRWTRFWLVTLELTNDDCNSENKKVSSSNIDDQPTGWHLKITLKMSIYVLRLVAAVKAFRWISCAGPKPG